MTHALLAGSPAIDAGDPAAVAGMGNVPLHDQRGIGWSRVVGGRIDIGAFEYQPLPPAFFGDYNNDGVVDAADQVVWRKTLGTSVAPYSGADGDGDGMIDQDDYGVWQRNFGESLPPGSGGGAVAESKVESQAFVPSSGRGESRASASMMPDIAATAAQDTEQEEASEEQDRDSEEQGEDNDEQGDIDDQDGEDGDQDGDGEDQEGDGGSPPAAVGTRVANIEPLASSVAVPDSGSGLRAASRQTAGRGDPLRRYPGVESRGPERLQDNAIVAWLASRVADRERELPEIDPLLLVESVNAEDEDLFAALDEAFETVGGGRD